MVQPKNVFGFHKISLAVKDMKIENFRNFVQQRAL